MSSKSINYLILSERELVFLLKSDDMQAFEQLYHNYKVRLYHNILRIIKAEEETEDLLRSVFATVWTTRARIDTDKPFRIHLFEIAENLIYNFFMNAALNKRKEGRFLATAQLAVKGRIQV